MILVADFDNTLYSRSDLQVLMDNLQVAQSFRQAGNKFILATGRNTSSLGRVLPDFDKYFDYVILDNGAVCLNQNNEVIFQYVIPEKIARSASRMISEKYGDKVTFVYYHSAKEWPTLDCDTTKMRCWTTNMQIGNDVLRMVDRHYGNQVQSFLAREALLSDIEWITDSERFHSFVDIMSKEAGKENAVRRLAALFPNEAIVAVGDDTNDLGMLTTFDGYAMQDSVQEVLTVIPRDHIVSSVAELIRLLEQTASKIP